MLNGGRKSVDVIEGDRADDMRIGDAQSRQSFWWRVPSTCAVVPEKSFPNPRVDKIADTLGMEIVAAADSDERGLTLLRLVNIFRKVLSFIQGLRSSSERVEHSTESSEPSKTSDDKTEYKLREAKEVSSIVMPTMDEAAVSKKIEEICQQFIFTDELLHEVCDSLEDEINKGLGKDSNPEAKIKCFPTYVRELPDGKEKGRFLALDLGGTNFRVLVIEFDDGKFHMDGKIFAVPKDIMIGPGTGLFDHIASCLAAFIQKKKLQHELLPLGFTFSFPCKQEGLTKARLATWTKGFKCAGVEGNDVVDMLQEAISRRGDVRIKICAVLNDTTGTLMSCAWKNQNCRIGLIVGTGSNACYMEKLEKVELWDGDNEDPQQVIINTEWGAFGDNGCLENVRTDYDRTIDKESLNPGKQLYEKMISGMYMGEIARQVIVDLVNQGLLFGGEGSELLFEKGSFYTKYISEIEGVKKSDVTKCMDILEELGLDFATEADCHNVRHVCECVSRRAAYLAGAGVAVLLNRINDDHVTVAVDGSVYRFHPHFHSVMVESISKVINPGLKFDLMLSEDGSGRGAALVAAVASRKAMLGMR